MKTLLICYILSFYTSAFSQEGDYNCGWYGHKTVEERNKLFPFSEAKRVVLVSYLWQLDTLSKVGDTRTVEEAFNIIKTSKISIGDFSTTYLIKEEAQLSEDEVNELSNILVNYTLRDEPYYPLIVTEFKCYQPRNAILFFDNNENVIGCIEICFLCTRSYMHPDPDHLNAYAQVEECHPRLNLIKDFFKKQGITYGINDN